MGLNYIYKNLMPAKEHIMLADSFLNALIAFSGELSWSEGVNLLYTRAVSLALRPYDNRVIDSILLDLGLIRIKKPGTYRELKSLLTEEDVAFGRIGKGSENARMAVLLSQGDKLLAYSDTNPYWSWIDALWKGDRQTVLRRIEELGGEAATELPTGSSVDADSLHQNKETEYFHYFQPNPESRRIGDCVVRAFCAVTGESWGAVMKQLASSLDGRNLDFNYDNNFLNLLLEKRYGRCHPTPKMGGRMMYGTELCEWLKQNYPNGDCKAFAFVGRSHVAGVLPERAEDGAVRYRFHDSWDSTTRRITDLFLKVDEPKPLVKEEKQKLTSVSPGTSLHHPQYGTGQVSSVTPFQNDALVTVQFDSGPKNFLKSWMIENCFLL